jgi:hypothetical protein
VRSRPARCSAASVGPPDLLNGKAHSSALDTHGDEWSRLRCSCVALWLIPELPTGPAVFPGDSGRLAV